MTFRDVEDGGKKPRSGLEVTEFFGPQALSGEKRERNVTNNFEAKPKIGAGHTSIEGIGGSRTSEVSYASRWKFTGSRFALNQANDAGIEHTSGSQYRQLVWHLEENELESQVVHNPIIHTGVAFHHGSKPFYVDLQIEAKLQKRHHRLLQHLVCPPRNRKARARAEIQPKSSGKLAADKSFPNLARSLNQLMTETNLHPVVEVSDPKPRPHHLLSQELETGMESTKNDQYLPNHDLLVLAQQLTGNRKNEKEEAPKKTPDSSTKPASTEDNTNPDQKTNGYTADSSTATTKNQASPRNGALAATSTLSSPARNPSQARALLVAFTVFAHMSQLLAKVLGSVMIGLHKLESALAQTGKEPELKKG